MARGGHLPPPPLEMFKVLYVLQMLSKVSVDEVFIHHFEKKLSDSGPQILIGELPLDPNGDFRLSTPSLPTPGKNCGSACTAA